MCFFENIERAYSIPSLMDHAMFLMYKWKTLKTLKTTMCFSGEIHTYYWYVNKNTGPTTEQEECSVSAYYSTVDVAKVRWCRQDQTQHRQQQVLTDLHVVPLPLQDLYSGLIGPLVVCRRSWGRWVSTCSAWCTAQHTFCLCSTT